MSLIFFSVKSNNGQLSRFYIILQCQSFSCCWLPQVTEPREWAMAPARQQRQLWSRQSPEPSEPERRTLSWSHSTPLHSPSVWPTDLQRTSTDIRSHPSQRFVTHAEHLWLFSRPCFYFRLTPVWSGAAVTVRWQGGGNWWLCKAETPSVFPVCVITSLPTNSPSTLCG